MSRTESLVVSIVLSFAVILITSGARVRGAVTYTLLAVLWGIELVYTVVSALIGG